ncbi:hypothetical protein BDC45DRAFT_591607 [Circinella umbellata]|nr:hypothetical protein BDC45DRAFT_539245 [Circinella umbellata]KAI7850440.1 hypothetical protein BDC45DRAFT_591607 [Circinella umbellata]
MSNFIDNAVRLLHERITSEPALIAAAHPAKFEILGSQYESFINNEKTHIGCKFIDKTSGVYTKERNPTFISKYGPHQHSVLPARQQTDETRVVKIGRPKTLSFVQVWPIAINYHINIHFVCQRWGTPTNNPPRNGKGRLMYGCTSKIIIRSTDKAPDMVSITYYWRNEAHQQSSVEDLQSAPVSREIKDLIHEIVEKDMTWKNVKSMIRLDKDRLGQILSGDFTNIPHVLHITYQELYYPMIRVMKKRSQLSP